MPANASYKLFQNLMRLVLQMAAIHGHLKKFKTLSVTSEFDEFG